MVVSASCYLEAFILARVSLHESHVFLALIVGAAGKLAVQLFYVPAQLFHSCKGLFGFLHFAKEVANHLLFAKGGKDAVAFDVVRLIFVVAALSA